VLAGYNLSAILVGLETLRNSSIRRLAVICLRGSQPCASPNFLCQFSCHLSWLKSAMCSASTVSIICRTTRLPDQRTIVFIDLFVSGSLYYDPFYSRQRGLWITFSAHVFGPYDACRTSGKHEECLAYQMQRKADAGDTKLYFSLEALPEPASSMVRHDLPGPLTKPSNRHDA
jgi:hypothetical protein